MVISSSRNGGSGKVNSTSSTTGSNMGASGGDTTGTNTVTPSNTTGAIGNAAKTTFPHPRRMMSGNLNHSHKTKGTSASNNHTIASSSGIKHNVLPMGQPSSSSSSGHAKSIYLDALQILNEETMLRACSLLLEPIAVSNNDDEPKKAAETTVISMNDNKNRVTTDNDTVSIDISGKEATEKVEEDTKTNPVMNEILPQEEGSSTQRRPTAKLSPTPPPPPLETTCPELEQLQQIYEQCRQAVRTLETAMRTSPPPRTLPHLPLNTSASAALPSSSNMASSVPGMITGRTKIVGGRGGDGSFMNRTGGGIRAGSMKRPLAGMSMSSTSSVSATNHPQQQSIHQLNHSNSKGLFGSMTTTTTGSNSGVLRRHRLERERSDSSVSITSTTSAAATATHKKSRITLANDAATNSQPFTTTTSADEALIPPPSARQFLAMLNNSDNQKAATATTTPMPQSSPASSSRRKTTIDSTATMAASTETANHDVDFASANPSNPASRPRRPLPEPASPPIKATLTTTTKTSTRMQPPRSTRK